MSDAARRTRPVVRRRPGAAPFVPGPPGTQITIRGLTKYFAGWPLYENFDLDIPKHKIVSVFGPNGCGKSTLINMIAGLVPIDAGEILFDGKSLADTKIGYVFQNYREAMFPWMRTIDNIAYPLKLEGKSKAEVDRRMEELVASFDVKFDLKRYPYELSGGQQQTASIMRALAPEPEVLFLDEPFSALDFEMTLFIREKLQEVFIADRHDDDAGVARPRGSGVPRRRGAAAHQAADARSRRSCATTIRARAPSRRCREPSFIAAQEAQPRDLPARSAALDVAELATTKHETAAYVDAALRRCSGLRASAPTSATRVDRRSSRASRRSPRRCSTCRLPPDVEMAPVFRAVSASALATSRARRPRRARDAPRRRSPRPRSPRIDARRRRDQQLHRRHARARAAPKRAPIDAASRGAASTLPPLAGVPYAVKNLFDVDRPAHARRRRRSTRDDPPARADATLVDAHARRRRRARRHAQHGRVRLRLHDREHALRPDAQSARSRAHRRRLVGRLRRRRSRRGSCR